MKNSKGFASWIVGVLLCIAVSPDARSQLERKPPQPAPQLIVKLAASSAFGRSVERAHDALNSPHQNADAALLSARAGFPTRARYLIASSRLSRDQRRELPATHPAELLHRWLVLEYPTTRASVAARETMLKNGLEFESVIQDYYDDAFAVTPTDLRYSYSGSPIYDPSSSPSTSMLAAHSLLGLLGAWSLVPGIAYVANLDNGVRVVHEDLANLRVHFSASMVAPATDIEEGAGYRGHGTHTSGIIAATPNNGVGTAGACWQCSLMVMKITGSSPTFTCSSIVNAMYAAMNAGAQVLNMSFSADGACAGSFVPVEQAIDLAALREVSVVAAAGNIPDMQKQGISPSTRFPATDPYVMSIGATTSGGPAAGWSVAGKTDFAAPGDKILSTFYNGAIWNLNGNAITESTPQTWIPNYPGTACTYAGVGDLYDYGHCTGTSMAAPMIAGSIGVLRSANPLMSDSQVKSKLALYANAHGSSSAAVGAGVPDVGASVNEVLYGTGGNLGLTPLFVLHTAAPANRFYTTVPQMASSAIIGGLIHGAIGLAGLWTYSPSSGEASSIAGYATFPGASGTPVAAVNVVTTTTRYGRTTAPLYRFSFANVGGSVKHAYGTQPNPAIDFGAGFVIDGIEGWVYPASGAQPPGTVRLFRKYNPTIDRYALFPESQAGTFASLGYNTNHGDEVIGFVCPNPLPNAGVCPGAANYFMPAITSTASTIFSIGVSNGFVVTASGTPAPTFSIAGSLPTGVSFTPGTGTLSGVPALGTGGTYPLVITAASDAGSADQSFTLTVVHPSVPFLNPGFEAPPTAWVTTSDPSSWTAGGNVGMMAIAYLGAGLAVPEGNQAVYLGSGTSYVSQSLNLSAGNYTLIFSAATRQADAPQPLDIYVNGVLVGSYLTSSGWNTYSIPLPGMSAGSHVFKFQHGLTGGGYALVDHVRLSTP